MSRRVRGAYVIDLSMFEIDNHHFSGALLRPGRGPNYGLCVFDV